MFLVGLLLLWSLVKGFFELKMAYKRVDEAKEELVVEEVKYEELKKRLDEVQREDYVEKVVRNKLNMQKEGETIVVLPDNDKLQITPHQRTEDEKENWEKWLDLLK